MFSSGSTFNRSLEKATSQLLLEPDWDSVLQIVDSIRQGDVQPKTALLAIRKKISNDNPHVAMFALQVLEACVKNCGSSFHSEVATKEFMEFFKDQAKARTDPVKEKILELIQTWSHAFRNEVSYKAVEDTFHLLKMEGHKFPVLKEADAMFDSERAPSWKDSETCTRCRVQFGVVQRKHHCRNCGEVFCNKCSSKTSTIPKLGFEREVRVCDACYEKINKVSTKKEDDLPAEYLASPLSKQSQVPNAKSEQEQQEEEELQLALALSKSEHETKEKERDRMRSSYNSYMAPNNDREASPAKSAMAAAPLDTSDMDPELARYLNRHYWQQKSDEQSTVSTTIPSAPAASTTEAKVSGSQINEAPQVISSHLYQNGETDSAQEQFLSALQGSLEIFVNRMRSNSQRGRPIANDSAVQSLFAVISEMHPQLMTYIHEKEESRAHYEGLQDKLTQLRDAREALDSLREEHREKRRREAEEMERLRQIQMMQKLEVMRQKKHEYLEMQRQLALQRLQEQEREMAARFEQQKHLTQIRQMQAFGYSQGYPQQMVGQPGMQPQGMGPVPGMIPHGYNPGGGSADGSPVHRMAAPGAEGYGAVPQNMAGPGMSLPPQSGMYSLGQQPVGGQYGGQAPPPGGYQPDGQSGMTQQSYGNMGDQGAVSMPPPSLAMNSGPASMGYNAVSGPISSASGAGYGGGMAGGPGVPGNDTQAGYGATHPPPTQDFSSFNMPDMSSALPSQQMYNNQQGPPSQSQQYAPGPQQHQPPQSQTYPPQQQYGGPQYQQPSGGPATHSQQPPQSSVGPKEVQLINFDD